MLPKRQHLGFHEFQTQKMLPKRQQKRKIGQKCAVNVAKKVTFTGPGTIELTYVNKYNF